MLTERAAISQVEQLTGCNTKYLEKVILQLPTHFEKDDLQSMISINTKSVFTEESILNSPIYYNIYIKFGGSHVYFKSWFNKGIRYINDLVNKNGEFYQQNESLQKFFLDDSVISVKLYSTSFVSLFSNYLQKNFIFFKKYIYSINV